MAKRFFILSCIIVTLCLGSGCGIISEAHGCKEHTPVIDNAVLPSCSQSGLTEGRHCSVCGEVIVPQNKIPPLGHTPVTDSKVLPSCSQSGLTEGRHCSVCGEVIVPQNEIPPLGHTPVTDSKILPSCSQSGLTEGKHCSVCGEIIVPQDEIPPLGHTPVTDPAKAPTYTEYGLTEGKHCSVCGEIIVPQKQIPKLSSGASPDDWNLILVNPWNYIPDGYANTIKLTSFGSHKVDSRCYDSLKQMLADCKAAGNDPVICSSFRTAEGQTKLFNNAVKKYTDRGYSYEEAYKLAAKGTAIPGTSEHQLGLAVDIVSYSNWNLNESQLKTSTQQWLMKNSYKYGFILRYPTGKSNITGIIFEPWHYRYVGIEAATAIYESGCCLEEYLQNLK